MLETLKQFLLNYDPDPIYPEDEESDNCARYGQFRLIQEILIKINKLELEQEKIKKQERIKNACTTNLS